MGSRVNNYSPSTANLTSVMNTLDQTRVGYMQLELTNMSTIAKPNIKEYSYVECGGALYQFSTEEPISTTNVTSTASGTNLYIKVIPTSSQITAELSTIYPTWRYDYKGWYESTSSINRFVGWNIISTSGGYIYKTVLDDNVFSWIKLYHTADSTQTTFDKLAFNTKIIDQLNEWSTSDNTFIPKNSGHYNISVDIALKDDGSSLTSPRCDCYLNINSVNKEKKVLCNMSAQLSSDLGQTFNANFNTYISTSDTVCIYKKVLNAITGAASISTEGIYGTVLEIKRYK